MYGDFPAKSTVCTLYVTMNVWFWPTLHIREKKLKRRGGQSQPKEGTPAKEGDGEPPNKERRTSGSSVKKSQEQHSGGVQQQGQQGGLQQHDAEQHQQQQQQRDAEQNHQQQQQQQRDAEQQQQQQQQQEDSLHRGGTPQTGAHQLQHQHQHLGGQQEHQGGQQTGPRANGLKRGTMDRDVGVAPSSGPGSSSKAARQEGGGPSGVGAQGGHFFVWMSCVLRQLCFAALE